MERAGIEPVTSGWQIQVGAALQRVPADAQLDRWDARAADTALTLRASAAHDHVERRGFTSSRDVRTMTRI
jgi:hypothetical protein